MPLVNYLGDCVLSSQYSVRGKNHLFSAVQLRHFMGQPNLVVAKLSWMYKNKIFRQRGCLMPYVE